MTNKNFDPKVVVRASQAAEGLCKWVRAMVLYDEVAKIVTPKKIKLAIAEHDYENTLTFLRGRRQMLAELNEKLDILRENLHETMTKKIRLENEVSNCSYSISFLSAIVLSYLPFFSLFLIFFLSLYIVIKYRELYIGYFRSGWKNFRIL